MSGRALLGPFSSESFLGGHTCSSVNDTIMSEK